MSIDDHSLCQGKSPSRIPRQTHPYVQSVEIRLRNAALTTFSGAGCKRILFDTDYLAALHQDNVGMNWDGIESINETGILTKKGKSLVCGVS